MAEISERRLQSLGKVLPERLGSESEMVPPMGGAMACGALCCVGFWLMLTEGLTFLLVRNPLRMNNNEFYACRGGIAFDI